MLIGLETKRDKTDIRDTLQALNIGINVETTAFEIQTKSRLAERKNLSGT
ncbi:hypothetical protein [Xenorhabdus eapokensis]|nr:hypothetical protein [Xenorhabdus eapokensis]